MQGFLATIITAFTPQVLFAMFGGFIGALISSDRPRYGWQLSLLFMVVAIFASAGMADYLYTNKKIVSIWWMFILNVPLGMVIGATLIGVINLGMSLMGIDANYQKVVKGVVLHVVVLYLAGRPFVVHIVRRVGNHQVGLFPGH